MTRATDGSRRRPLSAAGRSGLAPALPAIRGSRPQTCIEAAGEPPSSVPPPPLPGRAAVPGLLREAPQLDGGRFTNDGIGAKQQRLGESAEMDASGELLRASAGSARLICLDGSVLLALDHKQFPVRHLCETASTTSTSGTSPQSLNSLWRHSHGGPASAHQGGRLAQSREGLASGSPDRRSRSSGSTIAFHVLPPCDGRDFLPVEIICVVFR